MCFHLSIVLPTTVLCFTAGALSGAVDPATTNSVPEVKRTCRIVFPEQPNKAPKAAYLFDSQSSRRVYLPSMNFSKVLTLPSGELTLYLTSSKIANSEDLPAAAPQLKVPEQVSDFYILLSPDLSNLELPLQMRLIATSQDDLKPGRTLWLNRTDHKIRAKLGQTEVIIGSKEEIVSKAPSPGSGYYHAELSFQPEAKGGFRKITEQQWWHDADSRHLGIIANTGGRLPEVYFYRDFR